MNSRSRSWQDKLISSANEVRYAVVEHVQLRLARLRYEKTYAQEGRDPFITVYLPTYNRAELLMARAVPTVLAQTYTNFEFVIVGDCCTDDTEQLVRGIGDPRIRFYNLPSRGYRYPPSAENHWLAGPVVAANAGLRLARGRWIARLDDDDTWTSDHLEASLRFAQDGNYEFISAQYLEEREGKQRIDHGMGALDPYFMQREGKNKRYNPRLGGSGTFFYRAYLRFIKYNLHCWRKTWNRVNDIDFVLRVFRCGVRIGFLSEVTAYMIPRPGETTVGLAAYLAQSQAKETHFQFTGQ